MPSIISFEAANYNKVSLNNKNLTSADYNLNKNNRTSNEDKHNYCKTKNLGKCKNILNDSNEVFNNINNTNITSKNHNKTTSNNKVINISSYELKKEEIEILDKGLNFALAPKQIPVEEIICGLEDGIKSLK